MLHKLFARLSLAIVFVVLLLCQASFSATVNTHALTPKKKSQKISENQHARKRMRRLARSRAATTPHIHATASHRRHHFYERFSTSSFAEDVTEGDAIAGEDPVVRQAAIDALGNLNGTVVAI